MRKLVLAIFIIFIHNAVFANSNIVNGPVLVKTVAISKKDFFETYKAIGQTKDENSRSYTAKVSGRVDAVLISNGADIKKDDLLIAIDQKIANATKIKAEAAYHTAKQNYERDKSLLKKNISSQETIDRAKVDLENATVDLVLAQDKYDNMVIKAPFDGYVGVVHAQIGDDIKVGDYLFTIIADSEKTVTVDLPENLNNRITLDSEVFVTDTSGQKIQGKITAISNYLQDNGTIAVKLLFPKEAKIMHGSYVETEIIFNKHQALAVDEKTILKNNNGNFFYKVIDGKVKQIYIKTGSRLGEDIEISVEDSAEDLSKGDLIILEGLTKVSNGMNVELAGDKDNIPEDSNE